MLIIKSSAVDQFVNVFLLNIAFAECAVKASVNYDFQKMRGYEPNGNLSSAFFRTSSLWVN